MIAVLVRWKGAFLDLLDVFSHRAGDHLSDVGVLLDEFWRKRLKLTDQIGDDQ